MTFRKMRYVAVALVLSFMFSIQSLAIIGYAQSPNSMPPSQSHTSSQSSSELSENSAVSQLVPESDLSTEAITLSHTLPTDGVSPESNSSSDNSLNPENTPAHDTSEPTVLSEPTVMESSVSPQPQASPEGIVVDPSRVHQQFEGWGTSLCWWANALGRWTSSKKEEVLDLLFDEDTGLGLNIVRYNIGGGINPNELQNMRTYADIPSFQPEPGQWALDADRYQREILQSALQKGVDITEAFSNGPPYWMTYSKSAAGSVLGTTNNLYNDAYDDFANYIVRVLKLYKEHYGIEFRTIAPLNEPVNHWWIKGNNQEGCHFDRDKQNLLLKEVATRLRENGLLYTKISANEEASFENAAKSFLACDAYTRDAIAQINVHSYFGTDRMGLRRVAENNGKRLWVSECGVGGSNSHNHNDISSCMELNRKILWDLKDLSANGWLYWQAVEDEAGKNNWGFIHANFSGTEDYWVTKQYYNMMNYTKFIRPGCWIIQVDDNDTLAAYDPSRQLAVLVITNDTSSTAHKTYNLSSFSSLPNHVAHTLRTSPTENCAEVTSSQLDNTQLNVELPPTSVTTVVLDSCSTFPFIKVNDSREGVLNNHYEYLGSWKQAEQIGAFDNDNHWSDSINASYTIRFNGTQIALYGAKAPNHGIAAIIIDGHQLGTVDLYAAQREESFCFFQSDVLSAGNHTVTVQVTGEKSPDSSGTFVTADYALITGERESLKHNLINHALVGNTLGHGTTSFLEGKSYGFSEITDGRLDTYWSSPASSEKRIVIPLYSAASLSEIQVFAPDSMDYLIQVSQDGENFTEIGHHLPDSTQNGFWSLSSVSCPSICYVAVTCLQSSGQNYEIAEVKVFGEGYLDINDNTIGDKNMFLYQGAWQYYWFESNAYLQDNHYTNQIGASFSISFNGTGVELYGAKAANHGQAEIYLDGVSQGIFDYYAAVREDNVRVFAAENLASCEHTLEVKLIDSKNSLSTDNFITVDHLVIKTV